MYNTFQARLVPGCLTAWEHSCAAVLHPIQEYFTYTSADSIIVRKTVQSPDETSPLTAR